MTAGQRGTSRLEFWLGCAAVAIPIVVSLWFVHKYGVNVPFWDEWSGVETLQRSMQGKLTVRQLFLQHNEHRIPVPQLLMLLIDRATAMDLRARMAGSWVLLAATGGLLFLDFHRVHRGEGRVLLRLAPVAWLLLSLRQWENLLWGWQITLCSCVFFLVAALSALTRARSIALLLLAVAAGACASFSFSTGLLVWPLGLLILLVEKPRLPASRLLIWALSGAGVFAGYFVGYVKPSHHPTVLYFWLHPGPALRYFIASLGSPLAPRLLPALWAGWFVLIVSVAALLIRRRSSWRSPLPPALLVFAFASSALLTVGRAGFGPEQALSSRYSTFTGLGLIGLYLWLIDDGSRLARPLIATLLLALAAAQPGIDLSAIREADRLAAGLREDAAALIHFRQQSDARLLRLFPDPALLRERAAFLESNHLSVFHRPEPGRPGG